MTTLKFAEARACVIEKVSAIGSLPPDELVALEDAVGRVLAEEVLADRDYPPLARSIRDGYAVRAADLPGELRVAGEVRAGALFSGEIMPGEAIEIMTGAPMPRGADAVVMVEHTARVGDCVRTEKRPDAGEFVNPQGAETRRGMVVLRRGQRLDFARVAQLATCGKTSVAVYRRPVVAILATGDEIVEVDQAPLDHQIRNSNVYSLAAQVKRSGGTPVILPVARDEEQHTQGLILEGLKQDLLLLSGGVSAGKYDIVEPVLAGLGAEFYFDRVLIQPGQPLVFGRAQGKFFFGLPGNPASTMVTFELFARAAIELLGGESEPMLPMMLARLSADFRHKTGLTRFLPARLSADGSEVTPIRWQGSSDVPSMVAANAFLVADAERGEWRAGDLIQVLLK